MKLSNPTVRKAIYALSAIVATVAVVYGLITNETADQIVTVIGAVLLGQSGLALVNTPTGRHAKRD